MQVDDANADGDTDANADREVDGNVDGDLINAAEGRFQSQDNDEVDDDEGEEG